MTLPNIIASLQNSDIYKYIKILSLYLHVRTHNFPEMEAVVLSAGK
jgi:hypothetical protein